MGLKTGIVGLPNVGKVRGGPAKVAARVRGRVPPPPLAACPPTPSPPALQPPLSFSLSVHHVQRAV